jgi:hypothetical protein
MGRDAHGSTTGPGLGRTKLQLAADLIRGADDVASAVQDVDIPALQAEHLSEAQVTTSRQLYSDAPRLRDCGRQGINLRDGQHRTLGRSFLRGSLHDAGVSDN